MAKKRISPEESAATPSGGGQPPCGGGGQTPRGGGGQTPRGGGGGESTPRANPRAKLRDPAAKSREHAEALAMADDDEGLGISDDEYEEEDVVDCNNEDNEGEDDDDEMQDAGGKAVWVPGKDALQDGEQLEHDPSTYHLLHRAEVEWPCLSFDVMPDGLGMARNKYPLTCYVVAGTQADKAESNRVYVMKWSRLYKTNKDGGDDSDDEEEDDDGEEDKDDDGALDFRSLAHPGGVNRIRCMPQVSHIVATWADTGKVHMWNVDKELLSLDEPTAKNAREGPAKPLFTCDKHKGEGFAMAFNPHQTGRFISGDCRRMIYLWEPVEGGWDVQAKTPFKGHTDSVEDLQWKRAGSDAGHVFASASVDTSVRVWDVRTPNREESALHIPSAHETDVNVLSWNPSVAELLLTGADDGAFKIWDTRNVSAGPMANFHWHRQALTSVDWHPTDETCLAVSSADNTVSLWDMALEDDTDGMEIPEGAEHYPAQLLFQHMGQKDIKEIKWHPQIPGVVITTALDGFNIFRTCNI